LKEGLDTHSPITEARISHRRGVHRGSASEKIVL
jgi:hypothetical protein